MKDSFKYFKKEGNEDIILELILTVENNIVSSFSIKENINGIVSDNIFFEVFFQKDNQVYIHLAEHPNDLLNCQKLFYKLVNEGYQLLGQKYKNNSEFKKSDCFFHYVENNY